MQDSFLHEKGYTYTGPNNIYDLTVIEIKQLMRASELEARREEILSDPDKEYSDWVKYRNQLVKDRSNAN